VWFFVRSTSVESLFSRPSCKGYYRQGTSLVAIGRYDDAVAAYHCGMAKDPTNMQVKSGLAHAIRLRDQQPRDKDRAWQILLLLATS
jgi:cytochrome c-type biogenesis protein CcmH/NrfG